MLKAAVNNIVILTMCFEKWLLAVIKPQKINNKLTLLFLQVF